MSRSKSSEQQERSVVMSGSQEMSRRSRSWSSLGRRESRVACYREGEVTPLLLGEGEEVNSQGRDQVCDILFL